MKEEFQEGDVVKLKSGGPKMTILDIENIFIMCGYFDKQDVYHTSSFIPTSLTKSSQMKSKGIL
ncbi:DUF2158 domain-containing protein [Halosquirtibacter xylanolyticus]|uniref:DUF2158 domain-containing protein n=1 Tax=Halosquirtibacter xylanolyticus TaxID=3374599 RepID=UPI0037485674|nr:DUF2158 domain-containing protein [Prolixibacteraceae bacterium]